MNVLTIIVLVFCALAAIDYLFGSKFGLGKEFKKGFTLLGELALSMMGMIVIAPMIAHFLAPVFDWIYGALGLDPSIIPASLFANDMGGAALAMGIAKDGAMGAFNGLVVASMMGCTVSFTIPLAMKMVNKDRQRELVFGLLCGIVPIPIGCLVAGLISGIAIVPLLFDLLPLTVLAIIIVLGLIFFPNACVKVFKAVGFFIKLLVIVGLFMGIINFLGGREIIPYLGSLESAAVICLNAAVVLTGMLPLLYLISRIFSKPLKKLGEKLGVNEHSVTGIISSLANSITTFEMMNKMDKKGVMLNSAFAVPTAFIFADHLAFTMAFDQTYLAPMIVGKLLAGIIALVFAFLLYKKLNKKTSPVQSQPSVETVEQTIEPQTPIEK